MKNKYTIGAMLLVIFVITTNIPGAQAAHSNSQRISGNPEPGWLDWKDPAISSNGDVTAIVYVRNNDTRNPNTVYRIWMKISVDGGSTFLTPATQVSSGDLTSEQRHPDVTVVTMLDDGVEETEIFVTWQEKDSYGRWEVWIRNYTVDGSDILPTGVPEKISVYGGPYTESMYPRINGSYIPDENDDDPATFVMLVFQQGAGSSGRYTVKYSYMVHDASDNPMNPCGWTTPDTPLGLELNEENSFEHPSIDTFAYLRDDGPVEACTLFSIVCDEKNYDGPGTYRCCFWDGKLTISAHDYISPICETVTHFNSDSDEYGYPDCCIEFYDDLVREVVVWQADNDTAMAKSYTTLDTIALGPCKSSSMRGISIDHIEQEYYSSATNSTRSNWTNPGGITVIWRSGAINPSTDETYGIDSINLEHKGGNLRISHDYWNDDDGSDDSDAGTDYDPVCVYHETNDPDDRYIDISSIFPDESHVSYLKDQKEIWYFTLDDYLEKT